MPVVAECKARLAVAPPDHARAIGEALAVDDQIDFVGDHIRIVELDANALLGDVSNEAVHG